MKPQRTVLMQKVFYIVAFMAFTFLAYRGYEIYQLRQEAQHIEQQILSLKKEQRRLQGERKRLDDPRYLEKLAREEYNMVGKDELPLVLLNEENRQMVVLPNK